MEPIKIAVSGTGGGVGQSVVKALYQTDYQIVALDGEVLAPGLFAAPVSYQVPYASKPEYIGRLFEILKKENCRLMFPGLDAELPKLAAHREEFQKAGITLVVSSPEVIEIADNKLLTTRFLKQAGLPAPETFDFQDVLDGTASLPYPYILKPKEGGHRSLNVILIKKPEDLDTLNHLNPADFVAQEYIVGDEYTCGSVSFDGECLGLIVMRRILRDGDTHKCFVESNPAIEDTIRQVIRHLKPFGPLNVQLRLKDGVPYVFELNARCSGTTGARAISGFNEPGITADFLTKGIVKPQYEIKKTTILRYWKELVIEDGRLEQMMSQHHSEAAHFTKL